MRLRPSSSSFGRSLIGAVLLVVALTGCSSNDGSGEPSSYRVPDVDEVPVVDSSVRLPFQEYTLSDADRTRMQEGQARLLERCMSDRGFDVTVAGDFIAGHQGSDLADPFMWGGPFGTMPLTHAKRFGYKPEPGGSFVKGPGFYHSDPAHLFVESGPSGSDAAAEAAFYGDGGDKGGCAETVEAAIDAPLVDLIDREAELGQLAREHPEVEDATRHWIDCMAERGLHYKAVWDASSEFGIQPVSSRQIKVATADVECTSQSGWANYFYAVLADYERQAIDRDSSFFEAALEAERTRLSAIERELARGR